MGNCCTTESAAYKALKADRILDPTGNVKDFYTFDKVLGKGNFGVAYLVYDKQTQEQLACKSISKRKFASKEDIEDVKREIQIMYHLSGHPNVVKLRKAFEDKANIHLVMELCSGGELFDRIAERGHYSEKDAARMMRTIVSVVHHCHTMNVVHRDLKPENFLLSDKSDAAVLRATDFGLSRFFKEGEYLSEIVGSPFYVAPEVLRRRYNHMADIWSCGVILYILLCGWPPFHGDSTQQIFKNILTAPVDMNSDPWPRISPGAKDCVRRMLVRDPNKRATAEEILHHSWLKENGSALDTAFEPEILTRMRRFAKMNLLKKEALKVIAKSLPTDQLVGIQEMFKAIDEDGSGTITIEELREGLRKKGAEMDENELQRIVDNIDANGNQKIDYEEFLAATIHLSKLEKEENMVLAFQYFDTDNSGYITRDELEAALEKIGDDSIDVDKILGEADINNDGKIDYEEFCKMMRENKVDLHISTRALKSKMVITPKETVSMRNAQNMSLQLD